MKQSPPCPRSGRLVARLRGKRPTDRLSCGAWRWNASQTFTFFWDPPPGPAGRCATQPSRPSTARSTVTTANRFPRGSCGSVSIICSGGSRPAALRIRVCGILRLTRSLRRRPGGSGAAISDSGFPPRGKPGAFPVTFPVTFPVAFLRPLPPVSYKRRGLIPSRYRASLVRLVRLMRAGNPTFVVQS